MMISVCVRFFFFFFGVVVAAAQPPTQTTFHKSKSIYRITECASWEENMIQTRISLSQYTTDVQQLEDPL